MQLLVVAARASRHRTLLLEQGLLRASDHFVRSRECAAWQQHTSSSFSLEMFAGDHFFINSLK